MSRTISRALGVALFIAVLCLSPTIGFSYSQLSVTADPIKNDPGPGTPLTFSDNGLHVAWIGAAGSRYTAYVDGDAGNTYDEISRFTGFRPARQFIFSPDGSRAAYLARSGENRLLIVGGQEFPLRAQSSDITDFCFSPDGKQFAYAVTPANGDAFVVLNGKEQAHTATILQMQFSSNSAHFAYVASKTLVPLLQRNGNQTVHVAHLVPLALISVSIGSHLWR